MAAASESQPADPSATEAAPSDLPDAGAEDATGVILVVDDNPQNLELLQAYLEELDCPLVTATDGVEALEAAERQEPDIVLLDVMMPRMSGFQVCERLKANPQQRDIPIVMITALNEVGDVEKAVESGADDFLTKPVNKLELLVRVRSLLRVRLMKKQLERTLAELDRLKRDGADG